MSAILSLYAKVYALEVMPISGPSPWPRTRKVPPLTHKKLRLSKMLKLSRRREPDDNQHSKTAKKTPKKLPKATMAPFKCKNYGLRGHNTGHMELGLVLVNNKTMKAMG